jgi:UDP-N-acetylglucosamine/UDP-N-acetylgalactosamine diphosphorylase
MSELNSDLIDALKTHDQLHTISFWNELTPGEQEALRTQLEAVDLPMLRQVWREDAETQQAADTEVSAVERARAPQSVVRQPEDAAGQKQWAEAAEIGRQLLSDNRCAVVTVAGGQGTRLGFSQPKGMYPIGPITDRTLFQIFAEQIMAIRTQYNCRLRWLIMTSDATHADTERFFEEHNYFGLPQDSVTFFCQASLPAMDAASGRLLLSSRSSLSLTPDGHGGLVSALQRSGLLATLEQEQVDVLFYHQVDNPTVRICDEAFLGHHAVADSQLTTLVVRKTSPTERMGVLVDVDGHTEIIEYSELTPEQAAAEDDSGQWIFWAGNTAIHAFSRSFLQELALDGCRLPLHVAHKKVACIDEAGNEITPGPDDAPNAMKLERFIFDALPIAERTLIVEGDREREFNPVKNAEGSDSPATARAALNRVGRQMLQDAGIAVKTINWSNSAH